MKRAKPPARVEVKWTDACNVNEQGLSLEDACARSLASRCTVGWLLDKNDTRVVLAADYDPPEGESAAEYGQLTLIPTGWVTGIHPLSSRKRVTPKPVEPTEEPKP